MGSSLRPFFRDVPAIIVLGHIMRGFVFLMAYVKADMTAHPNRLNERNISHLAAATGYFWYALCDQ